jgi:hypothetical protein
MLVRGLGALVLVAVLALFAVSLGLVPAREPGAAPTQRLDVARAVDTGAVAESKAKVAPSLELRLGRFGLGRPGGEGARSYPVEIAPGQQGLLVFAPGAGYELFAFELGSVPPRARRMARFASKAALPGGAAGGDFDGDGVHDLVLGVAPARGVLHEPGSGAFLVRGRRGGGYEAPRPLAETATQDIAAADLDGAPPTDVLVLTRGDLAAQRPGELWSFTGGPLLARSRVVRTGLDPRDLLVLAAAGAPLTALVVAGQPGGVFAAVLPRDAAAPVVTSTPLVGAQGFVHGGSAQPLVRTPTSLHALTLDGAPKLEPWAVEANVGPAVKAESGQVLGALVHGVAALDAGAVRDELAFGDALRVRDLVALGEASGRVRVLAVVEDASELSLVVVPTPPWESRTAPVLESSPVEAAHGFADVPLE